MTNNYGKNKFQHVARRKFQHVYNICIDLLKINLNNSRLSLPFFPANI